MFVVGVFSGALKRGSAFTARGPHNRK